MACSSTTWTRLKSENSTSRSYTTSIFTLSVMGLRSMVI